VGVVRLVRCERERERERDVDVRGESFFSFFIHKDCYDKTLYIRFTVAFDGLRNHLEKRTAAIWSWQNSEVFCH
jgi:hypothetical protein